MLGQLWFWLAVIIIDGVICCRLSRIASRGKASWAWGLLGPIGIVIAAIIGLQPDPPLNGSATAGAAVTGIEQLIDCPNCGRLIRVHVAPAASGQCPWCKGYVRDVSMLP